MVGQLGATYIVAEGPDGMYLIDQHAAHERILYEQMLAEHAANRLAVQPLLEPLMLDLSPEQAAVAAEELETLNDLGWRWSRSAAAAIWCAACLRSSAREDPASALVEIIDGLAQQSDLVETTHEARLVTLICKRAAIKGNTPMQLGRDAGAGAPVGGVPLAAHLPPRPADHDLHECGGVWRGNSAGYNRP